VTAFRQPRVYIPFAIITLIWGSTWLVIIGQLGTVPPVWSVTYRFTIAAAAMFAFAATTGASLRIGRQGHWLAALVGVSQFCLNYNFVYFSEIYITSGIAAVVFALLLIPNSIFARIFLKHRIGRRFIIGSVVATAGVALLFVQEVRASTRDSADVIAGITLALLAVISASVANVIQAAEQLRTRPLPVMIAWAMAYGVLVNAVVAWAFYGPPVIEYSFVYLAGLVYLGLAASALAFTFYFAIIREVGPGPAAYTSLLIPIIAMILSTIFEGYVWTPLAWAGAVLALAGLVIALKASRTEAEGA
jgi:drug/metabolite transporter (DMT)-like permease